MHLDLNVILSEEIFKGMVQHCLILATGERSSETMHNN